MKELKEVIRDIGEILDSAEMYAQEPQAQDHI